MTAQHPHRTSVACDDNADDYVAYYGRENHGVSAWISYRALEAAEERPTCTFPRKPPRCGVYREHVWTHGHSYLGVMD